MDTCKTIRWGIIGCGNVVETKNGPATYLAEGSELAGIWNRTRETAEKWIASQGCGRVYDSMEELLADPDIDIVYVATPPNCHRSQALAVAAAKKHCYLEKPIATFVCRGGRHPHGIRRGRHPLLRRPLPPRHAAIPHAQAAS